MAKDKIKRNPNMKKCIRIIALLACAILLFTACSPRPVKELNCSFSSSGLRMTATDMCVEPCSSDDRYLVVTTYFLIENTTRRRTIPIWIKSDYSLPADIISDGTARRIYLPERA
jgi:hypothetical protein